MYVSDSIDQLLTVLFMLVAVAAFVIFFTISDRTIFLYVGGGQWCFAFFNTAGATI